MPHHTERDRNDKNEKDTGKPVQLDKDNKAGQQQPGRQQSSQRPMEHERPQHGGEQHSGGGMKK